jgi:hypothetical protein
MLITGNEETFLIGPLLAYPGYLMSYPYSAQNMTDRIPHDGRGVCLLVLF